MIDKNDKEGTIRFLVERIKKIREDILGICPAKNIYIYDHDDYYTVEDERLVNDDIDRIVDLCDKTLIEVTF